MAWRDPSAWLPPHRLHSLPASQVVSFLPVRSAIETEAMQVRLQRVRSSLHSTQPARAATPCLLPLACTGRGMLASTAMAARVE